MRQSIIEVKENRNGRAIFFHHLDFFPVSLISALDFAFVFAPVFFCLIFTLPPLSARAMTAENPLFHLAPLPRFDLIGPEHVAPAIDALLAKARAALEEVTAPAFPARWQALSATLDVATERLSLAWGVVSHLNAVADTPQLRAAYNAALSKITEFYTHLGSDERLYAKYKAIDPATLNDEQRQALKNALRGFVLGGAELQGEAKKRFATLQERSAELT